MSVQPRAHKNFRLRRARQQPLSDVSRAENRCPRHVPETHFVGEPVIIDGGRSDVGRR